MRFIKTASIREKEEEKNLLSWDTFFWEKKEIQLTKLTNQIFFLGNSAASLESRWKRYEETSHPGMPLTQTVIHYSYFL